MARLFLLRKQGWAESYRCLPSCAVRPQRRHVGSVPPLAWPGLVGINQPSCAAAAARPRMAL